MYVHSFDHYEKIVIFYFQLGMRFQDLYRSARESFFVSSDVTLRAQLNEFIDHKLVRNKRTVDGVERLIIPLDNSILKQFIEDQA